MSLTSASRDEASVVVQEIFKGGGKREHERDSGWCRRQPCCRTEYSAASVCSVSRFHDDERSTVEILWKVSCERRLATVASNSLTGGKIPFCRQCAQFLLRRSARAQLARTNPFAYLSPLWCLTPVACPPPRLFAILVKSPRDSLRRITTITVGLSSDGSARRTHLRSPHSQNGLAQHQHF